MADNTKKQEDARAKAEKRALKAAQDLQKIYQGLSGDIDKQTKGWSSITNAIFGLNRSDIFEKVKQLSTKDIASMNQGFSELNDLIKDASSGLDAGFKKALKGIGGGVLRIAQDFSSVNKEMSEALVTALQKRDLSSFVKEYGNEGLKSFSKIIKGKGFIELEKFLKDSPKDLKGFIKEQDKITERFKNQGADVISISNITKKLGENFSRYFSFDKIISKMMDFDNSLSNIQRQFNVINKEGVRATSESMSDLVKSGAEYGVSLEDSFKSAEELANIWRTANIPAVAETVKQIQMIPGALGIAREDVSQITGNMKFLGSTTEDVSDLFQNIAKDSALFGVSTRNVTAEIAKNLPKWQRMGFKEGESSLVRMAAQMEKVGVHLDSILQSADKFYFSLDESIDAASTLQLLGGKFASVNPFDLMSKAQQGGDAYTDMLKDITSDVVSINEKGIAQISPINKKRLEEASKALGMSYDDMFNIAKGVAQETQKLQLFPSLFNGLDSVKDKDARDFIMNAVEVGKDGKLKLTTEVSGIKDLTKLTPTMIKEAAKKAANDAEDLKARNIQNQSLKESFDSFVNSLLNVFTVFEPALKFLAGALNTFTGWMSKLGGLMDSFFGGASPAIKGIGALTAALLLTVGTSGIKAALSPLKLLYSKEAWKKVGSFFKTGAFGGTKSISATTPNIEGNEKGPGFLKSLGESLNSFPDMKKMLGIAAGIAAIGVAILGIGAGIMLAAKGLTELVGAFRGLSGKEILGALGALLIVMGGFTIMVIALASASTIAALPLLALGAAFLLIGAGIGIAAYGLSLLVKSFVSVIDAISKLSIGGVLGLYAFSGALLALTGSLVAFAFAIGNPITWIALKFAMNSLTSVGLAVATLSASFENGANGITTMVDGINKLKTAIKGLDVSSLKELADISEKMATASAIAGIAGLVTGTKAVTTPTTPQKITVDPITVKVEMTDSQGRVMWEKMTKANAVIS